MGALKDGKKLNKLGELMNLLEKGSDSTREYVLSLIRAQDPTTAALLQAKVRSLPKKLKTTR